MRKITFALPVLLMGLLVAAMPAGQVGTGEAGGQGVDPMKVLDGMGPAYEKVADYTAVFIKRELVKGALLPEEHVQFKFKKPFMVYMKWLPGPHEGREALYVKGRYGGKVTGHEGGFFGFVTLHMSPTGKTAMRGNRHPITDVGIGRLVEIVMENVGRARREGELKLGYKGEEEVFGRKAVRLHAEFPPDKGKGYYCRRLELWVDGELGLPVRIMVYGWEDELLESYGYKDLIINPGLAEAEFDPEYKEYGF